MCKECGGSAFCVHGREKSTCKECGGSLICVHGRHWQKHWCKECGRSRSHMCVREDQLPIKHCEECQLEFGPS